MNYEMFIPLYGNYMTMKELASEESQQRPLTLQFIDAINQGIISASIFGFMFTAFPTQGAVIAGKTMLQTVVNAPVALPVVAAAVGTVAVLELYDRAVVSQAPAEEESFWWRVWSSGLTGAGVTQYY